MTDDTQQILEELFDEAMRKVLIDAGKSFINYLRTLSPSDGMPYKTGRLQRGIVETERDLENFVLFIESVGSSPGSNVDYPAILDGRPGKWFGWWDNLITGNEPVWARFVEEAGSRYL